jgi:carnitine O-acetyltransferase
MSHYARTRLILVKQRSVLMVQTLVRIPAASPPTAAVLYPVQTIYPYLTFPQNSRSEATIREFGASESLQAAEPSKRLEARAAKPGTVSWLANWWNDAAYMTCRDHFGTPEVINVNQA